MIGSTYARGQHCQTLVGYLENIERLAVNVKTIEDFQFASVDLLDNCRAAITLLRCMC